MKLGFKEIIMFGDPSMLKSAIDTKVGGSVDIAFIEKFYQSAEAALCYKTGPSTCIRLSREGNIIKNFSWPPQIDGSCLLMVYNNSKVVFYLERGADESSSLFNSRGSSSD